MCLFKENEIVVFWYCSFGRVLRDDEMSRIQLKHITFESPYMCILLPSSKTDQLRDGNKVLIAKTGTDLCPVSIMMRYIKLANVVSGNEYVFFCYSFQKGWFFCFKEIEQTFVIYKM